MRRSERTDMTVRPSESDRSGQQHCRGRSQRPAEALSPRPEPMAPPVHVRETRHAQILTYCCFLNLNSR